jgi:hypothetical protein
LQPGRDLGLGELARGGALRRLEIQQRPQQRLLAELLRLLLAADNGRSPICSAPRKTRIRACSVVASKSSRRYC